MDAAMGLGGAGLRAGDDSGGGGETAQGAGRAGPPGAIALHLYLTRRMALRHGVSLSQAMRQGILARADFADMVSNCRVCPGAPERCRDLIEDHDAAAVAPEWCANRTILEGLRGLV
jgi:hypothetical protein